MTTQDPASHVPPRLPGVRDPGDAWVTAADGTRYWGRFGAAGLLVHDPARGVLLQHRAMWSHHGGTWGIPGGALHAGEPPAAGALREANEEAGVPADAVVAFATSAVDREVWRYTTVLARVERSFTPHAGDAESLELAWVTVDAVAQRELHPAFAQAWPRLRRMLDVRPVLVVDAANVVGSRPDGWWKDRAAATQRLVQRLAVIAREGLPAAALELDGDRWMPRIEMVIEGRARDATAVAPVVMTVARGSGDDLIVERAAERREQGDAVTVVTSDRGLAEQVREAGATTRGAGWLLALLDEAADPPASR
ncbi:NUDIX hydrolase [Demequina activiva]|uniref:NTP pyrophosphohydrolase n=1 Tax=Demequina activiva TaxID=1582364 RepID=A0A919Q5B8_9MICO|nr:NUDIX hydrolase [Demequina activiva]GIG54558.1 NTP pyrophosphohydrolase [Demequina activiva]